MPSGFRPRRAAAASLITTHADAPSENWLALPAVTVPPGSAGLSFATPSYVVSARMPSSAAMVTSLRLDARRLLVGDAHRHGHRHDLVREPAGGECGGSALLALHAVLVLALARDAVAAGDGLRGLSIVQ